MTNKNQRKEIHGTVNMILVNLLASLHPRS